MALWTNNHVSFSVETYLKNIESPTTVQKIFRRHFHLGRHDKVLDHRTIVMWVAQLRNHALCRNKKTSRPSESTTNA
ncbi:hypothetical protein C0J52_11110 [Blattella germanica]|nr:hypothetical protein C0J52_11110 [Blattella germanica]